MPIEIRALCPASIALAPLTARLAAGDILAFDGPSGVGKTTLGRCIAGLHPKASGEVVVDGLPLGPLRRGAPYPVQYLYQDAAAAMNPAWTVAHILAETRAGAAEIAAAGVDPAWQTLRPHALSGGQAQRVALARTLATRPRLLICDEITAALDPPAQAGLWQRLLPLAAERDMALVVITHDAALRDRIATQHHRL